MYCRFLAKLSVCNMYLTLPSRNIHFFCSKFVLAVSSFFIYFLLFDYFIIFSCLSDLFRNYLRWSLLCGFVHVCLPLWAFPSNGKKSSQEEGLLRV